VELSTLFLNQNKCPEALAILGGIIDIYNHEQVHFTLGKYWMKFEDDQQAIFYLRKSTDINPDLTEVYY
jgi:tetratricopeptide (TPR) repeat protein